MQLIRAKVAGKVVEKIKKLLLLIGFMVVAIYISILFASVPTFIIQSSSTVLDTGRAGRELGGFLEFSGEYSTYRSVRSLRGDDKSELDLLTIREYKPINRETIDCYVINIDSNLYNLKRFNNTFMQSDIAPLGFTRISAVNGRKLPQKYINKLKSSSARRDMGPGAIGVYLSFRKTFKQFLEASEKTYALIFEDDVEIDINIDSIAISHLEKNVPKDWDIILLGYFYHDKMHRFEKHEKYNKMYNWWGLHGYLINKRSAKKLLDLLKPPLVDQIDGVMSVFASKKELNVYGIKPLRRKKNSRTLSFPVWQNQTRGSSIQILGKS
jgi:glycosyl transferase family 25